MNVSYFRCNTTHTVHISISYERDISWEADKMIKIIFLDYFQHNCRQNKMYQIFWKMYRCVTQTLSSVQQQHSTGWIGRVYITINVFVRMFFFSLNSSLCTYIKIIHQVATRSWTTLSEYSLTLRNCLRNLKPEQETFESLHCFGKTIQF